MWLLLLRSPWTYAAAAMLSLGAYAAVQHLGWKLEKANFAQFRAEVVAISAENEARTAQQASEHERNAREAIDDLQTRYDALGARYDRLRRPAAGNSPSLPTTTDPADALGAGLNGQPDPATGCLAQALSILELGDREIAKYRELWELEVRNAKPRM